LCKEGNFRCSCETLCRSCILKGVLKRINVNNLPELKTFRTELRQKMTPAEAVFWRIVKNSKLDGRKFRRQHSVGRYVLDFYCPSEKVAIELDGEGHYYALQHIRDMERDRFLRRFGIKVLRFENRAVFDEPIWMIEQIRAAFGWKSRPPER
jgi:very-short-patch-repair endonuclease